MHLRIHFGSRQKAQRQMWIGVCAVILLALLGTEFLGESGYFARRERRKQMQTLREDIQNLQQENTRLTEQIHALRSDPHAIEEMAREQLRMARPGEFIISLPPGSAPPPAPPSPSEPRQ